MLQWYLLERRDPSRKDKGSARRVQSGRWHQVCVDCSLGSGIKCALAKRTLTLALMTSVNRALSAVTVKVRDAMDADSIPSRSTKGALGDAGKRKDFEVTCWICERMGH